MVRRITVDNDNQKNFGLTGWGIHTSGHVDVAEKDRLAAGFVAGRGLGRYLLGLSATSGAFVISENREIIPRTAYGGFITYKHQWNSACRSTVGPGAVSVETDPRQTDAALRASLFGLANLMCSVNRFVTIGGEYSYGRRWNRVGSLDNNRFMFGIQVF